MTAVQANAPAAQPAAPRAGNVPAGDPTYAGAPMQLTPTDVALDLVIRCVFDLFQRSLAAPIDRVMVLTAVEGELIRQGRLPPCGFGGIGRLYKRIWKKEGVRGFLRGVAADALLTLPSGLADSLATNAVFVCLQRFIPARMADHMSTPVVVALSLAATSAAVWVATPYNAVRKTIMTNYMADIVAPIGEVAAPQAAKKATDKGAEAAGEAHPQPEEEEEEAYRYATATETARQIYRRKGFAGFYRGAAVEPVTVCAYRGLYLIASVFVSERLQMSYPYVVARALAVIADVITQPLEVVSRRLVLTASDDEDVRRYKGVVDCAKTIVREEGVTALWSGLRFRLMVSGASIAIRWLFVASYGNVDV